MEITTFKQGFSEGNASHVNELGGKGANLCEMANLNLPVPSGVVIPTDRCNDYRMYLSDLPKLQYVAKVTDEAMSKLYLLDPESTLYSVRSGARKSMPGMMDTLLNIGLTTHNLDQWKGILGERVALDCRRRQLQMYGNVVYGIPMIKFEGYLTIIKLSEGVTHDCELSSEGLEQVIKGFEKIFEENSYVMPDTIDKQMRGAVMAVWKSWDGAKAKEYRKIYGYPDDWGTAVTIQRMVFGNMNEHSCSGVMFSRNPATGEDKLYGEYLPNAQGEDVVAGVRTPLDINTIEDWNPDMLGELEDMAIKLEDHYKDMQDMEFTVQDGTLYLLQTRVGKRSSKAAIRIAYDLYKAGKIDLALMKSRISVRDLIQAKLPTVDMTQAGDPLCTGIAAGGGVVSGVVVTSSQDAVNCNLPCILVSKETTPDDIAGMKASLGILTQTGGMTSHAAVVARGMNKSCVVGAIDLDITAKGFTVNKTHVVTAGEIISIDGATGNVWKGTVPLLNGASLAVNAVETLLLESVKTDVIIAGTHKDHSSKGKIYIPLNFFGAARINEWADAVEDCIVNGLSVFVNFDSLSYTDTDNWLLDITGQGRVIAEEAIALLEEKGLLDKVTEIKDPGEVTLHGILQGHHPHLNQEAIDKVFGNIETYKLLLNIMAKAEVKVVAPPVTKTKFELLQQALEGVDEVPEV